jgi:choline kinase
LNRSTTTIKKSLYNDGISVVIVSAGMGSRIRSNEPRSLIKIKDDTLVNHQIQAIADTFKSYEIIGVFGTQIEKILKKVDNRIRVVENQLHNETNNSESMRLGLNNSLYNNVLFIHGDIYFKSKLLKSADYTKSFLVVDANEDMSEKEVGLTANANKVSILSYGLEKKWCQMCFLTGKELKILKSIFLKFQESDKKMLSFEVINKIIENGGSFACHEKKGSHVVEIDCIKDINNENFNL